MPSSLVKGLCRFKENPASLYVRDDPGTIRLRELKDRPALDGSRLLPLWSIFLRDLSRHARRRAVSTDPHAFRLDLHANGTGLLKRNFITRVQFAHSRPNLLQGVRIPLLKCLCVPLN